MLQSDKTFLIRFVLSSIRAPSRQIHLLLVSSEIQVNALSRVAVFESPGLPLRLDKLPFPALKPGEALVRIRCATICGSDLHTIFGRRRGPAPCILGHEMVGDIAATQEGGLRSYYGDPLGVGDRVT